MTTTTSRTWALLVTIIGGLSGCASESKDERSEIDGVAEDAGDSSAPPPRAVESAADGSADAAAKPRDAAGLRGPADAFVGVADAGAKDASSTHDTGASEAGVVYDGGPLVDTVVEATIVVKAGASFDGAGKRFRAGPALGDGSQSESQKPVFKLEAGAKLSNVVLGAPAADGIHTHGDATLENIVWEDIGEDALTIKEEGTVELRGGSATDGEDKIFQINAASTFRVSDFRASNAGKFVRQNGGTTFKVQVFIERCDISNMGEAIFRTDSKVSTVSMTNTRYSKIGDSLFLGVTAANIVQRDNTEYESRQ